MTLRKYLFLLFAGLILIVTIAQVALIYLFQHNIEREVHRRSHIVAEQVLKFTVDSLDENGEPTVFESERSIVIPPKSYAHNKIILLDISNNDKNQQTFQLEVPKRLTKDKEKFEQALSTLPTPLAQEVIRLSKHFVGKDIKVMENKFEDFTIRFSNKGRISKNAIRKQIQQHFKHISKMAVKENGFKVEMIDGKITTPKTWREKHRQKPVLSKMVNAIVLIIVATSLLALALVFWLSKRFNAPLQQLIAGFKQLEKGDFGITVTPSGVAEMKQTMGRFNKMSEQLQLLAEAEAQLQQQQHLSEIGDVSRGIAHALRNPMHTIGLAIEQLQQPNIPKNVADRLLNRINNKIAQLDKNIAALLTITSGEIERDQLVNLTSVINDVVLELKQTHDDSDTELNVNISGDKDLTTKAATNEIRTVLHTLIFNAYEAATTATVNPINIDIKLVNKDGYAVIDVLDNGTGLTEQELENLFTAHHSSKAEGAGMGLYISKRITELYYNGSLDVTNREEEQGAHASLRILIME